MTEYEVLITKANKCVEAAIRATNKGVSDMWMTHARQLQYQANQLPVATARIKLRLEEKHRQFGYGR